MGKNRKCVPLLATILLLVSLHTAAGDEGSPYVDGSIPFMMIKDVNRQAEAWGTCAAAYEILAELIPSKPAQSRRLKDLSNGAIMSVMMIHFLDGLSSDITQEQFNTRWSYAKILADSIPQTQRTRMLADAEALESQGLELFTDKILATVNACADNLEGQRVYVDTWRELAKSGLLTLPNE